MSYEVRFSGAATRGLMGALGEPGPIADGRAIHWMRHREGGFFVVQAGWNRAACDVLPERRIVLVFAVEDTPTLATALGIDRYSFVHTVFSSR